MRQCEKPPPTRRQLLNFQWSTDYISTCIQGVECKHSDTMMIDLCLSTPFRKKSNVPHYCLPHQAQNPHYPSPLSLESIVTTVTARNVPGQPGLWKGSWSHHTPFTRKKDRPPQDQAAGSRLPFTEKEASPWPFFAGPGLAWVPAP